MLHARSRSKNKHYPSEILFLIFCLVLYEGPALLLFSLYIHPAADFVLFGIGSVAPSLQIILYRKYRIHVLRYRWYCLVVQMLSTTNVLLIGPPLGDAYRWSTYREYTNVSSARSYPNAAAMFFTDHAVVDAAAAIPVAFGSNTQGQRTYCVAPVVATNASQEERHTLNVVSVCRTIGTHLVPNCSCATWPTPISAGLVGHHWSTRHVEKAFLEDPSSKYKAGSTPPLLLQWVDPDEVIATKLTFAGTYLGITSLIAFTLIFWVFWTKVRRDYSRQPDEVYLSQDEAIRKVVELKMPVAGSHSICAFEPGEIRTRTVSVV